MSNNQQEMDQRTTTAINNLINKASTKFDFIKLAMDSLPADKKYDVDALLEKTRSRVEQITKNRVGERAAKTIANALTVRHIVELYNTYKTPRGGQRTTTRESSTRYTTRKTRDR